MLLCRYLTSVNQALVVDIYRAAKRRGSRRGKYPPLTTDTEVNSCFSIY